ncbi:MAG: FMN-binding glutamate synthase family protein, partial [Granulosicoccaceae bacterium]
SAMSFGALSPNAVRALNGGAKLGNFAHNTGEGGLSPYHREEGGDLIWQIGTGYFGCRLPEGGFCADRFAETAQLDQVKMVEIKLSQGAKPGHGGILPAAKNTAEIASIRGVTAGEDVLSPPTHSAFGDAPSMMRFVAQLRELSGGKPIGIKLCVGQPEDIVRLCRGMLETDSWPDFITVDGGEGGTGAAPLEFSNSVGMPLREALALVDDCLCGFGLRKKVKIIAAGRMFTAFHMARNLALGADACYSARAMMLALGCVQSLLCNTNECPTGIATQDRHLVDGLVVEDKRQRVARYHEETVQALAELVGAAGLHYPAQLQRAHIYRRVSQAQVLSFADIFPPVVSGSFVSDEVPERYTRLVQQS